MSYNEIIQHDDHRGGAIEDGDYHVECIRLELIEQIEPQIESTHENIWFNRDEKQTLV